MFKLHMEENTEEKEYSSQSEMIIGRIYNFLCPLSFSFLSFQPTAFPVQEKYEGLQKFMQAWILSRANILLKPVN